MRIGLCAALLGLVSLAAAPLAIAADAPGDYVVSYAAGARDAAGRFMGGTELRSLVTHGGKLYAGIGYWEDRPGPEGPQGAAILVLDGPKAAWRAEQVFDERLPGGRGRDLAVSALSSIVFATGASGETLSKPVAMLVASTWDLTGATRVFSRDEASGAWRATTLSQDSVAPDFIPQIRSFGMHRDRRTGIDHVFAGNNPRGIFAGVYDPAAVGCIRWGTAPELSLAANSGAGFSGLEGRVRVNAFAESEGVLYAAVGQQIYQRVDGPGPTWKLVYTNPQPGHSETGLRGLTAIANPAGGGESLLAAVEGTAARIVRVDPKTGRDATDVDVRDLLADAWRMPVGYVIAAYNDMTKLPQAGGEELLIGLESFIPPRAQMPAGHISLNVGHGRLEGGAWYLVRHKDGRYDLRQIKANLPTIGEALVATRSIVRSPFPGDGDGLYFGGYDANKAAAHNTAWVVRANAATLLGAR
jgi:hypothetical protein